MMTQTCCLCHSQDDDADLLFMSQFLCALLHCLGLRQLLIEGVHFLVEIWSHRQDF